MLQMPASYPNVHCDGSCATVKELLPWEDEQERIMGKCAGKRGTAVPIRFRCAYCNQLMGISRRKAGTVVRCPTCSGRLPTTRRSIRRRLRGTDGTIRPRRRRSRTRPIGPRVLPRQGTHPLLRGRRGSPLPRHPRERRRRQTSLSRRRARPLSSIRKSRVRSARSRVLPSLLLSG